MSAYILGSLRDQGETKNGGIVGKLLTHVGYADYTLPVDIMRVRTLTGDEAAHRYAVLLTDVFSFLNELAPHGYSIQQVLTQTLPDGKSVKVTLKMLVSEPDHRRIQAEWHPLIPKDSPPDWKTA